MAGWGELGFGWGGQGGGGQGWGAGVLCFPDHGSGS